MVPTPSDQQTSPERARREPRLSGARDIIVIGASAGGVQALTRLVSRLPEDLPAAIFVVVHMPSYSRSMLPAILNRSGTLPAAQASDGEQIRAGRIYVASPDRHLLVGDGRVRLTRGPREHGHRPSADALFRSAAKAFGPAVIGVVLSGALNDGSAGLLAIKKAGGVAIAQSDATYQDMPRSAAAATDVDHIVPLDDMPALFSGLVGTPVVPRADTRPQVEDDPAFREEHVPDADDVAPFQAAERDGRPSEFACPDCGGVLWQLANDEHAHGLRFRCRVGHAFTAESLVTQQGSRAEDALWAALRALEERSDLFDRLAKRMETRGFAASGERFAAEARAVQMQAATLRAVLLGGGADAIDSPSLAEVEGAEA